MTAPAQEQDFNGALAHSRLMPLDKVFTLPRDAPEAKNTVGGIWAKECQEFVHLCLYGEGKQYQKAFLEFRARTAKQPPTEEIFKQCFKMSYRDMLSLMRGYVKSPLYQQVEFAPKKGEKFPGPPALALRQATEAEISRMKGESLHMAGRTEAARENLIAAYVRGSRDPELLAAIGLAERSDGHDDRARKFLEAAVAGHTHRARAYLELARLHYAADTENPAGPAGRLGAEQVADVLPLLTAARAQPPALPEVYELEAELWRHAVPRPADADLKAIDEGVVRFPRDLNLVYSDAQLRADLGMNAFAAKLSNIGLLLAPDEASRARFCQPESSLPAAP